MKNNKKLVIIGLDSATPKLLFEDFIEDCPNIKKLVETGVYGTLQSSNPPITIPAWIVMVTGKQPGTLGIYGFRHRKENSYTDYWITNSNTIKEPKIWDIIKKKRLKSIILGIPPTYPVKPLNGHLVAGFIAPDILSNFTYPPELKEEISENIGEYIIDIKFRTNAKEKLLKKIYHMTEIQFKTIRYLMQNKEWDFIHFVIIGLDRFHHGFWKFYDEFHHKYKPGNMFETSIKNYYEYLDKEIGEILKLIDENTIVMIVSDHGVKAMKGCICVNMVLEKLKLLKFKKKPQPGTILEDTEVDWENTIAWGWGGYCAKIFLNVKGREKNGIVKKDDYDKVRNQVAQEIMEIKDIMNNSMNTKIYKPEDLYPTVRGDAPDLMVYFDDLNWRAAGTVGYDSMYLDENDTGPDDAVHDYSGVFIIYDPKKKIGIRLGTQNILDIAPTVLNILGVKIPKDMEGKIILF